MLGEVGKDSCPKGYNKIVNKKICEYASDALSLSYSEGYNDSDSNSVCFLCGGCNQQTTRVDNRHGENAKWVCYKPGKINCDNSKRQKSSSKCLHY